MKIAYADLANHLKDKPSIKNVSEKLFQLGHEHEILNEIFDIEFTPNRGDCLSLNGLSRDLNLFFDKKKEVDIYDKPLSQLKLEFKNLSPKDCPKISFLEIEIDSIYQNTSYIEYMENYFKIPGNKKVNFFTDISNYLSYELGQPTHCYDRKSIGDELIFENINYEANFLTLQEANIRLKGNDCIFRYNDEIINLAGIMGGKKSACSNNTKIALVECAYFRPEAIAGKTIKYNLKSDASYKFERNVDLSKQEFALRRFIKIVQDHVKIKNIKFQENNFEIFSKKILKINLKKINDILGTTLEEKEYLDYLTKLDFEVDSDNIKIPFHRNDVLSQNDLAEEVARALGYNKIKRQPLKIKTNKHKSSINKVNILRHYLVSLGFTEVINFPFTDTSFDYSIVIDNPLDLNKKNLRTNLQNSLLGNLLYNERRQQDSIMLFEISDIYSKKEGIKKEKIVSIVLSGNQGHDYKKFSQKIDIKFLKNLFNNSELNFEFKNISRDTLDTKKKNQIFFSEKKISGIPEIFFKKNENFNKDVNFIKYKSISDLPSNIRDISFSITNKDAYEFISSYFETIDRKNLKDIFMFDFFKNYKSSELKIGYRFIFQSQDKTLSDQEVNRLMQNILNPILEYDGIAIPGYR